MPVQPITPSPAGRASVFRWTRAALLGGLALALACGGHPPPSAGPEPAPELPRGPHVEVPRAPLVFPSASGWERVEAPERAGYRRSGLDSLTTYLRTITTTGLMVIAGGLSLYEYGNLTELSYLASSRKSILSMLYGRPVADGTIRLDMTLARIGIDDVGGLTAAERRATVRDLLLTSSGVYHPASNPGDNLADAPPRGSQRPGEYFLYSNWDFNALGTIYTRLTGRQIHDALAEDIARPTGMEDFDRSRQRMSGDTTRSRHLAYHMWLSTRDMARVGYLMLREGNWNGAQLIPRDWVRESTTQVVPSSRMNPAGARQGGMGYAYLWWTLEAPPESPLHGAYASRGAFGQYIMIIPKLDLVVAHKRAVGDGRTGGNEAVTWPQFMGAVERLLAARCPGACPLP